MQGEELGRSKLQRMQRTWPAGWEAQAGPPRVSYEVQPPGPASPLLLP